MRKINLIGQRFGRLVVLSQSRQMYGDRTAWECLCDCGEKTVVCGSSLKRGFTKSCGCLQKELLSKKQTTHGYFKERNPMPEVKTWCSMKSRCYNPSNPSYPHYGGAGVVVCKRWLHSICNFIKDMGKRPSNEHSLDRINVYGNYEPSNCRWATIKEQNRNKKTNIWLELNGKKMLLVDWAKKLGISQATIHSRYYRGCSDVECLNPSLYFRKKHITIKS